MKKILFVLILMVLVLPVFAQSQNNRNTNVETDLYYVNIPIEKIYPSSVGYIIQYRKGVNEIGTIGIPNEWFTEADGKAELMKLPPGTDWPSMSVFYSDGVFSHVRVYVHHYKGHRSWGSVPMGVDVSRNFENSDDFKIEFQ